MAKKGLKFIFHGAFSSKRKAKRKEHSRRCKRCFILERKIRGNKRFIVVSPR